MPLELVRGIAREFQVRHPYAVDHDLICPNVRGSFKALGSGISNIVILIDAITANTESAHQDSVLVQRKTAGKEHDTTLIRVRSLRPLRARIGYILGIEAEEWSGIRSVDSWRKQRLRAKANGSIGHRRS